MHHTQGVWGFESLILHHKNPESFDPGFFS